MLSEHDQRRFKQVCLEHIWAALGAHSLSCTTGAASKASSAANSVRELVERAQAYRECWEQIKPIVRAQGFGSFIAVVERKPAAVRTSAPEPAPTPDGELPTTPAPSVADDSDDSMAPAPEQLAALARLEILTGPSAGRELELSKPLTKLGLRGMQIAAIARQADGYRIVPLVNGNAREQPLVNGAHIGAQARALRDKDIIQIAGLKARFRSR